MSTVFVFVRWSLSSIFMFAVTQGCKRSVPVNKTTINGHHTNRDTLTIFAGSGDTLRYPKAIFNDIIDLYPELTSKFPSPPDVAYAVSLNRPHSEQVSFTSEARQDEYYGSS